MTSCAELDSNLLFRFQEFYSELLRFREQVTSGIKSLPADSISQTLGDLLERQASDARTNHDQTGFEVYREAQYVMAALADEVFQSLDWDDRHRWNSLELRLFRANAAGELFFRKLDWLLQHDDQIHLQLAQIYFFAMCLGFQGKYRETPDRAALALYRQKLFVMIFGGTPKLFREKAQLVALPPVQATPAHAVRYLPPPRLWLALPAGVILLWFVLSFAFWARFVRPVAGTLDSAPSVSTNGGH